jgi:uncharacterized protein (DUF697 family)/GTP-binding protein EngB required for normal cell division
MTDDDSRQERVQRALGQGRRLLDRGVQELGGVVSRGVRAVTAASGASAQRPSEADRSGAGQADVEAVAADPASYFNEQRQREAAELGHANILITGQTGVGKSTLVNAIFRAELAKEGVGRPVTQRVQRHDAPGVPVTIFDTPGIELGDAKDAVIADFKKTIAASRRDAAENFIHLAWYCIDAGQTRIQGYDVDVIRALADEVPVILVLTQCVDQDRVSALETAIAAEHLPIQGVPVRTLAKARRIGEQTIAPTGLEELVWRTEQILPKAVKGAFVNAQGVVIGLKVKYARAVVAASAAAAGAIGAAPIPVSDAVILMPVQIGMLGGVTAVFGIEMSAQTATRLVVGLVGEGGVSQVGRQMAAGLLKVIPGVNVVNAGVATALTAALGEAYIQLCREMLRRQGAGLPMPDAEMLSFLLNAYEKTFQRSRIRRDPRSRRRPAGA